MGLLSLLTNTTVPRMFVDPFFIFHLLFLTVIVTFFRCLVGGPTDMSVSLAPGTGARFAHLIVFFVTFAPPRLVSDGGRLTFLYM